MKKAEMTDNLRSRQIYSKTLQKKIAQMKTIVTLIHKQLLLRPSKNPRIQRRRPGSKVQDLRNCPPLKEINLTGAALAVSSNIR